MRLPYLKIDLEIVEENIRTMAVKASEHCVEFRPHFKTHQSYEIGQLFKKHGVNGITVSSVYMAEYFAEHGWADITIAFPAGLRSMDLYNKIAKSADLKLLAINADVVKETDQRLVSPISMYIEIDPGYGRSGIRYDDIDTIQQVLTAIKAAQNITFEGFYCHAGHSYKCSSKKEIIQLTDPILNNLKGLKSKFGGKVCYGDTPSCSVREDFEGIDQISAGNFVFYDWMQVKIGACSPNQIAVSMFCEVAAKYTERNELLIHGGAVHFSKDFVINQNGQQIFGVVANDYDDQQPSYIKSLSQEHGLVACSQTLFDTLAVGDTIEIYPIHSCLTANLMREYVTKDGAIISQFGSGSPYQH